MPHRLQLLPRRVELGGGGHLPRQVLLHRVCSLKRGRRSRKRQHHDEDPDENPRRLDA